MKKISEQIREIVRQSSMSPYAIAREAGIHKSVMSRFMNGGTLTMAKLDALANALGIIVSAEVARVPRPLEKGRPKKSKGKQKMATLEKTQDHKLAANLIAQQAYDLYFDQKSGFMTFDDGVFVYYNNHPYASDPNLRHAETKRIRSQLRKAGFEVIASGHGGSLIEDERLTVNDKYYTIALLIRCDEAEMPQAKKIIAHELARTMNEFLPPKKK